MLLWFIFIFSNCTLMLISESSVVSARASHCTGLKWHRALGTMLSLDMVTIIFSCLFLLMCCKNCNPCSTHNYKGIRWWILCNHNTDHLQGQLESGHQEIDNQLVKYLLLTTACKHLKQGVCDNVICNIKDSSNF